MGRRGQDRLLQRGATVPLEKTLDGCERILEDRYEAWLDDYVDGSETDFLLDYSFDWLMYRTIFELNFYLKEDERVQLSTGLVKEAWDAMVIWNNELIAANVDTTDLD